MSAPTERQRQVLRAIHRAVVEHGVPPTLRELGAELGIKSNNGVNDHLKLLMSKGLLQRAGGSARSLRLTTAGLRAIGDAPRRSPEVAALATAAERLLAYLDGALVVPEGQLILLSDLQTELGDALKALP